MLRSAHLIPSGLDARVFLDVLEVLPEAGELCALQGLVNLLAFAGWVGPKVVLQQQLRAEQERGDSRVCVRPLPDGKAGSREARLEPVEPVEERLLRARGLRVHEEEVLEAFEALRVPGGNHQTRLRALHGVGGEQLRVREEVCEELEDDGRLVDLLGLR